MGLGGPAKDRKIELGADGNLANLVGFKGVFLRTRSGYVQRWRQDFADPKFAEKDRKPACNPAVVEAGCCVTPLMKPNWPG